MNRVLTKKEKKEIAKKAETIEERKLITEFVIRMEDRFKTKIKILKLQGDVDDGLADGIIEIDGIEHSVEGRRKGFPNHEGKTRLFINGWKTKCLVEDKGIFLNESTIRRYKNKGFIYIVDINWFYPKVAIITAAQVDELLRQPFKEELSTNDSGMQSIKTVPLEWFKTY